MIALSDSKFEKLQTNDKILFFEVTNNASIKGFMQDINEDDKVVLIKLNSKNKNDKQEFENFKKKLLNDGKIVIVVDDL